MVPKKTCFPPTEICNVDTTNSCRTLQSFAITIESHYVCSQIIYESAMASITVFNYQRVFFHYAD